MTATNQNQSDNETNTVIYTSCSFKLKMNPSSFLFLFLARSQLREPVAPYSPVFFDGWKPEVLRPDGQVWEDPVESQHKNEDLRVKQEVRNT